jgi:hypothetical protein
MELSDRLTAHVSDGKFCIWSGTGDYYGETSPQLRFGFRVDWRSTNPCPTEEELLAITF